MRIYIAAVDVQPGDLIAHVGKVETVDIVGDDVVFTMHWAAAHTYRLALDAFVWVDHGTEAVA
jgi:hypothetical protein